MPLGAVDLTRLTLDGPSTDARGRELPYLGILHFSGDTPLSEISCFTSATVLVLRPPRGHVTHVGAKGNEAICVRLTDFIWLLQSYPNNSVAFDSIDRVFVHV